MYVTILYALLVSISLFFNNARGAYVLVDDYSGEAFFRSFEFFTGADPTNGHVKFKSMTEANSTGLAGLMDGGNATQAVYMGVDTISEAPNGRGSVRVSSTKSYQHALVVADIVHMPGGICGKSIARGSSEYLADHFRNLACILDAWRRLAKQW